MKLFQLIALFGLFLGFASCSHCNKQHHEEGKESCCKAAEGDHKCEDNCQEKCCSKDSKVCPVKKPHGHHHGHKHKHHKAQETEK